MQWDLVIWGVGCDMYIIPFLLEAQLLSCASGLYIVHVVVNFLSQVIFVFLLFLGMVMYANEIETKEK